MSSKSPLKKIILGLILLQSFFVAYSQQSVSIGDTQIKANAVLYLKGSGSQGLIIPVVASNGAFGEPGMVIFNSADKKLYYHNGMGWIDASGSSFIELDGIIGNEVSQINSARGGLEITGAGTTANPLSIGLIQGTVDGQILQWNNSTKKWELKTISVTDNQDLSLTGTTLSLTNDGTSVTLGALSILNAVGSTQITDASVNTADLAAGAVTTGIIADGTIANADISGTAAIAVAKLAPGTNGQVLTVNAGAASWQTPSSGTLDGLTDATVTTPGAGQILVNDGAGQFKNVGMSGDVAITTAGATTIQAGTISGGVGGKIADGSITSADLAAGSVSGGAAGVITDGSIVNVDINAAAAIAGTKISPDFGSQTIRTTGATVFNTVPYTWPNTQGAANSFLVNDGTGIMSWAAMTAAFSTANVIPKGDGVGLVASTIYEDINGNVGIGTTTPTYKLHVVGSNPSIVVEETGTMNSNLIFQRGGVAKWYLLQNFQSPTDNIAFYDASIGSKVFQINQGGNIGIGTTTPSTKLEVNGYTKLGSDNTSTSDYCPAIKVKKISMTTAASQGGCASALHGVTPGKIIGVQVMVDYSAANIYVQPAYTFNAGYEFNWIINPAGSIQICNIAANSGNILSKPATIIITYEE
jgi:hypothetical protein